MRRNIDDIVNTQPNPNPPLQQQTGHNPGLLLKGCCWGLLPGLLWAGLRLAGGELPAAATIPLLILGPVAGLATGAWRSRVLSWQQQKAGLLKQLEQQRLESDHRLQQLQEQWNEELQRFHRSSQHMERSLERREVLRLAAESLHQIFDFDRVNLMLLADEDRQVEFIASLGTEDETNAGRLFPFDQRAGILHQAVQKNRAYLVENIADLEPELHMQPPLSGLPQLRSRSFIVCTICSHNRPVALFGVDNKIRRHTLTAADVGTVELFARQASSLLDRLEVIEQSGSLTRAMEATFADLVDYRKEYLGLNRNLHQRTQSVAGMAQRVTTASSQTGEALGETSAAVSEIAATAVQLTDHLQGLTEHMDQAVVATQQLSQTAEEIDARAVEAEQLASAVQEEARNSNRVVGEALEGLKETASAISIGATTIDRLVDLSREIDRIITGIHDINDRTSLLALNASIIAAQAGEQGRPFAVVASEMRALAKETGRSADIVEELTEQIQSATQAAAKDFTATRKRVAQGLKSGSATQDQLGVILDLAQQAENGARGIRHSTTEQARGSRLINTSVEELQALTKQSLRATEEQAKGCERIDAAMTQIEAEVRSLTDAARHHEEDTREIEAAVQRVTAMAGRIFAALKQREADSRAISERLAHLQRHNSD